MPDYSVGRITLASVAREAGVAVSTVSLVLNGKAAVVGISSETVRSVRAVAERLGYRPNRNARSLRLKRSGLVGVVLAGISYQAPGRIFEGIRGVLERSGAEMEPLLTSHEYDSAREHKELSFLAQNRVEAVIATPFGPYERNYGPIVAEGIPAVFVAHGIDDAPPGVSGAYLDSEAMSREAVRYLAAGGARRIAYLAWNFGTLMSREKLRGVQSADPLIAPRSSVTGIHFQAPESSFDAAMDAMFADPSGAPDAVLCNPYDVAIAAMDYLDRRNLRVPSACAVMSLDDNPAFRMQRISVTAMTQDYQRLGIRAAEIALEQIRDKDSPPIREVLPAFAIVPRGSTNAVG